MNKRWLLLLLFYLSLVAILLLLTMKINFNLTGYNYYLDEKSMVLTIEKDFVKKEMYDVHDNVIDPLKVMLLINKAYDLWLLTILVLSLFISVFVILFFKPLRPRKNVKFYVVVYIVFLAAFIIWDFYVHKELIEEISNTLK